MSNGFYLIPKSFLAIMYSKEKVGKDLFNKNMLANNNIF